MYILFLGHLKVIFLTYCNHILIETETLTNALVQKQLMSEKNNNMQINRYLPSLLLEPFFVNVHVHKSQMFIVILITLSKAGRPCQALEVSFSYIYLLAKRENCTFTKKLNLLGFNLTLEEKDFRPSKANIVILFYIEFKMSSNKTQDLFRKFS